MKKKKKQPPSKIREYSEFPYEFWKIMLAFIMGLLLAFFVFTYFNYYL